MKPPKTDRKRREPHAMDYKYMTEDGFQRKYFQTKREAIESAKTQSSWGTVVLCAANGNGQGFTMIGRYRFGRSA